MAGVSPVIRYLIVCEDIPIDPGNPRRVSLRNLIGRIRPPSQPPFPHRQPEFCVYIQLTECRGVGDMRLEIEEADTQTVIFQTVTRRHSFGNDPLKVLGMSFRVHDCVFPSAGLYSVQLCYNGSVIAQAPLKLE